LDTIYDHKIVHNGALRKTAMKKRKAALAFALIVVLPALIWKMRTQHNAQTPATSPSNLDAINVQFASTVTSRVVLLTINFEADCEPEPLLFYRLETDKIIVGLENQKPSRTQCRQDFQNHLRIKVLSSGTYFVFWDGPMTSKPLKVDVP